MEYIMAVIGRFICGCGKSGQFVFYAVCNVLPCSISWEMYPKLTSESVRQEQEELDIRTLQLLRACVHNEERKLPENWEENPSEHKKYETLCTTVSVAQFEVSRSVGQGQGQDRPNVLTVNALRCSCRLQLVVVMCSVSVTVHSSTFVLKSRK